MLCKKCGTNVLDGIKFCPNCGASLDTVNEQPVVDSNINNVQDVYQSTNVGVVENVNIQQPVVEPIVNSVPQQSVVPVVNNIPQQPINNVPPVVPTNNSNMYNNVPNNGNKSNSGLGFVIGAIVVAVVVCVIIIIGATSKKDDDEGDTSNSNSNSTVTSNIESNTTSNITSNVTSNTTNTGTYAVTFAGYSLQIPNSYSVSSNTSSQLQLMGTNLKDVAVMSITSGDLKTLKTNPSYVNSYAKSSGYTVTKGATSKTYNGVEFFVLEMSKNNVPMIIAYAQLPNNKLIVMGLSSTDYTLDYSKLNLFAYTVKTAKVAQ